MMQLYMESDILLDLNKNNFAIDEDIYLGDQFSVCERCREKIRHNKKRPISTDSATRELEGKLAGKKIFKAGEFTLCAKCVKDIYDKLYNVDTSTQNSNDEDLIEQKGSKR